MWSGGREDTSCEDSWRISSINVLGALFWKWPIVIKDSGFEKKRIWPWEDDKSNTERYLWEDRFNKGGS